MYEAFTPEVHAAMTETHAEVVALNKGVIRGKAFRQYAYGKMVPMGARMPQGGATGDDYAPYVHMDASSLEGIRAVLAHGRVSFQTRTHRLPLANQINI